MGATAEHLSDVEWKDDDPLFKFNDENVAKPQTPTWYIIAMILWFCWWRQEHGWWPLLPACSFQVEALATATSKTWMMSVTSQIEMTLGKSQVLQVLTTLQRAHLQEMYPTACSLSCHPWNKQRSPSCPTLYWDISLWFNWETLQLKWTYHVLIYPCYPWV